MKTNRWQKAMAFLAVVCVVVSTRSARGEITQASAPEATPAAYSPAAPSLPYGAPQILQLAQAKISDATIIAYVNNARISYNLDASQIIYLRQSGVSEPVLMAMLNQPKAYAAAPAPAYVPAPDAQNSVAVPATPPPSVTYVQTQPSVTYVQSSPTVYYAGSYYPCYGYYSPISVSFGWGYGGCYYGGYRGGYCGYYGGYRGCYGGYHGGVSVGVVYHGGGGFHGGGHH